MLMLICSLLVCLCPITFLFPVTSLYDYVFSENGLVAYKNGELIHKQVSVLPPPVNLDNLYPHFVNVPNVRIEHCWKLICVSLKMKTKNGDSCWRGWGGGGGGGEEGKGERGATFHGLHFE